MFFLRQFKQWNNFISQPKILQGHQDPKHIEGQLFRVHVVELKSPKKDGKTPKHDHDNQHYRDIDVPQDIWIGPCSMWKFLHAQRIGKI